MPERLYIFPTEHIPAILHLVTQDSTVLCLGAQYKQQNQQPKIQNQQQQIMFVNRLQKKNKAIITL